MYGMLQKCNREINLHTNPPVVTGWCQNSCSKVAQILNPLLESFPHSSFQDTRTPQRGCKARSNLVPRLSRHFLSLSLGNEKEPRNEGELPTESPMMWLSKTRCSVALCQEPITRNGLLKLRDKRKNPGLEEVQDYSFLVTF